VAHGQRPRRLTVAGAAAALPGLALVLDLTGSGSIQLVGVLWGLGAAFGLAGYFVLSARVDAELPSVTVASAGMGAGAAMLVLLGAVGVLPMHATFGDVTFAGHQMSWLVPVAGLSLVAAVVAYVAGIGAARILGARLSSFVGLTEVLFAILVAWVVLGELPTVVQLIGGVLILAGVTLVRVDELRATRGPRRAADHPATPELAVTA
jgi:drug/metabolite transporter (DMT)-like permease